MLGVFKLKPGFPILGVFRLKGQSKRDGSIIVRSCKARQSSGTTAESSSGRTSLPWSTARLSLDHCRNAPLLQGQPSCS